MSRPQRVTVVNPQTRLALTRRSLSGRRVALPLSLDTRTARAVYRSQRRLAATTMLVLAVLVFGLPPLFAVVPVLSHLRVAGAPLSWVLLGVAVYPVFLVLAIVHSRLATRAERVGRRD